MRRLVTLVCLAMAIGCGGGGGDGGGEGTLFVQNTRNSNSFFGGCGESFTVTRQGESTPVFVTSVGPCQGAPLQLEPGIYQVDVDALGGACRAGGGFHQTVTIIDGQTTAFPVGCESCSACPG